MNSEEILYIKDAIEQLPKGNITYKTIRGKKYTYLQWTDSGKQYNRRVKDDELQTLSQKIEERKTLEKQLRKTLEASSVPKAMRNDFFFSQVKYGQELIDFVEPCRVYKKRECFSMLRDYVYGNSTDRIFILYGLRRTGKTTLIRQLIAEMPQEMFQQTAFVRLSSQINLVKLDMDMRQLKKCGYRYVFVDEVTLMKGFSEGAALLADVFASSGMKIVLSGTASLGFAFSEKRELYERCRMMHTTFIPYREFENVLGIKGFDEYIRYGGTMSFGGVDYTRKGMPFATKESTVEYINCVMARDIQSALEIYQNGEQPDNLSELYEAKNLPNAINRIVADINYCFVLCVLLHDGNEPNRLLQSTETKAVIKQLCDLLTKKINENMVELNEAQRDEIKKHLYMLNVVADVDTVYLPAPNHRDKRTVVTQPGMQYAYVEALIRSLMQDDMFRPLSLTERNMIAERLLSEIQQCTMEDIILLETKMALPQCEVFKLMFANGGFDMVIFDPAAASCSIFEVEHRTEKFGPQDCRLLDEDKCKATEFRFGTIEGKYVIYCGETHDASGVIYLNVEEYLKGLQSKTAFQTIA